MHAHRKPVRPLGMIAAQFNETCHQPRVARNRAALFCTSVDAQCADRLADAAQVLVDVWVDLLGLCAVELMQQLLLVIVGQQGLRLAPVGGQAGSNRCRLVVGTLLERFASDVVLEGHLGRVELRVVGATTGSVDPAPLDAPRDLLLRHSQVHHARELSGLVKCFCLGHGPGESVKQPGVILEVHIDFMQNKFRDKLVRYQLPFIHVGLHFQSQLSLGSHVLAHEVPA